MGTLVKTTFPGLVVLSPSILATLYWSRANKWGCIASILSGEAIVFLSSRISLPTFGFLPAMIALLVSSVVLVMVSILTFKK
jgi:Na+/proline symporter